MKPGSTSRPVARDSASQPITSTNIATTPIALVATAVGGLPDIIDDGRTGRLVPPRDPAALAAAIVELLTDPDRRAAIVAAAAEREDEFTIETATSRFVALYEQLAARTDTACT